MKLTSLFTLLVFVCTSLFAAEPEPPRVADDRLEVICFASSQQIVHPINMDFDARGRLLVIESHTHFRPPNYEGPAHDRIRMLEDTDGDGRADKFTTFFEGSKATMDIATASDGSVYVASRSEIFRLVDRNGDGQVGKEQIVQLKTAGDYPHNGLSGLAFDHAGNLWFGMGENLGASYELVGSDGKKIADHGEGGNVFTCTADGKNLRRVATGFWNPFGITIDVFGRKWVVDNDPDSSPPCRLLQLIDDGDYGFQFRYGRSGRHPFHSWNGQLPGTLPMVSGTGEAPCEVLSYESDGLPKEYVGDLFVTSWADHRIERYQPKPHGASYTAERKPFVQGGSEFRPVGLTTAPDGSLFFSDWVRKDYNLHNQGAVWQVRMKNAKKPAPLADDTAAALSLRRPVREAAARRLAKSADGRETLRSFLALDETPSQVRAAAMEVLANDQVSHAALQKIAEKDANVALRAHAVELLLANDVFDEAWLTDDQPAVKLAAIAGATKPEQLEKLVAMLRDEDPFLYAAAIKQLSGREDVGLVTPRFVPSTRERIGLLLAHRKSAVRKQLVNLDVGMWIDDPSEDVRFMTAKWIADDRLTTWRTVVNEKLQDSKLSVRMYQALATALARIDGEEVSDAKMADVFVKLLADDQQPAARRMMLLKLVPASHKDLKLDLLQKLIDQPDHSLKVEAIRTLAEHPDPKRFAVLSDLTKDYDGSEVASEAIIGLASQPDVAALIDIAAKYRNPQRIEALRALVGAELSADQKEKLQQLGETPMLKDAVNRVLKVPSDEKRPDAKDTAAWLKLLEGPADPADGRRVFFHPKLAGCARCHRVDGHGQTLGPDLSLINNTERRHVLESILQPSLIVAPHFQVWQLELADGQVKTGMLVHTNLDDYTYVDAQGKTFKVRTTDIVDSKPSPTSIMPTNLADTLTIDELRNLLAFLTSDPAKYSQRPEVERTNSK